MLMRLIFIALLAMLVATGCGRRGSLQPPPGATDAKEVPVPGEFPGRKDKPDEEDRFILDGLL